VILEANAAAYTVVGRRDGYEGRSRTFVLPAGTAARVTLTLPLSDATPVELVSDPPGAEVWIDGQPWLIDGAPGRTPFTIATLPPGLHVVEMGGLPELGTWRGEVTLRPGTSYAVRGTLPKPDAPPPAPAPAPSHHHAEAAAHAVTAGAGGASSGAGALSGAGGPPSGAGGAPGVTGHAGASGTIAVGGMAGESGAAVVKPYRPPPDSGILFLDLQGGAPRAP
jgi:hypothetical protein